MERGGAAGVVWREGGANVCRERMGRMVETRKGGGKWGFEGGGGGG